MCVFLRAIVKNRCNNVSLFALADGYATESRFVSRDMWLVG